MVTFTWENQKNFKGEKMKISVIVCVYNRLEYLKNLIICLNKQTIKPYELIIADDGSSEDVNEILGGFENFEYKVKHAYQEDRGFRLAASRNNGFREVEGDYVVFLDQDVIFDETFFEKLMKKVKKGTFMKITGINTDENEKKYIEEKLKKNVFYKMIIPQYKIGKIRKQYIKDIFYVIFYKLKLRSRAAKIVGLAFGVWKEDYIKINGFDEGYEGWGYEDDDFGNRLTVAGIYGIPFLPKYPIVHMYHPFDPTKKKSMNEEYYRNRKNYIFEKKDYFCKKGLENEKKCN